MINLSDFIKHKSVSLVRASNVKLNVNAQEFVPRFKEEDATTDGVDSRFKTIKTDMEALDERKTKSKLTLPWKGFPKKSEKAVVVLYDEECKIVPRTKKTTKSKGEAPLAGKENSSVFRVKEPPKENVPANLLDIEEKRREKERKVAVEALKLVEQRRWRGALLPTSQNGEHTEAAKPIVHLSRSPVKYTPEERIKVDHLRAVKKERIERILNEMHNEMVEQQNLKKFLQKITQQEADVSKEKPSVVVAAPRRYIPTAKEWDEQCRAKQEANLKSSTLKTTPIEPKRRDVPQTRDIPRYRPPCHLFIGEKRKGNLTHSLPIPNWTPRRIRQVLTPLENRNGRIVQRYSIEQLLHLEPQSEELEMPDLAEGISRLDIVC